MSSKQKRSSNELNTTKKLPWEGLFIGGLLMAGGFLLLMAQFREVPEVLNWRGPAVLFFIGLAFVVAHLVISKKLAN